MAQVAVVVGPVRSSLANLFPGPRSPVVVGGMEEMALGAEMEGALEGAMVGMVEGVMVGVQQAVEAANILPCQNRVFHAPRAATSGLKSA